MVAVTLVVWVLAIVFALYSIARGSDRSRERWITTTGRLLGVSALATTLFVPIDDEFLWLWVLIVLAGAPFSVLFFWEEIRDSKPDGEVNPFTVRHEGNSEPGEHS